MGKMSQGQRLKKSLKIVKSVFNEAKNSRFSFHTKKKSMDDSTIKTYRESVESVLRKIYASTGNGDIFRMTADQVAQVIRGMPNASSAKRVVHAMSFFQTSMEHGNSVHKPPELISRDEKGNLRILNEFREEKRFRYAAESSVMKATREQVQTVIRAVEASRARNKSQTVMELKLESMIGTRISEALALRAQDINIHEDGTATVHVDSGHAKGGRSRDVDIRDKSAVEYLRGIKERVSSPTSFIVERLTKRNGDILSIETIANRISKTIKTAALRAEVRDIKEVNGKKITVYFSSHSARKTFASEMVAEYTQWSNQQLRNEIERRIEDNREVRHRDHTYSDYAKKWDTLRHRINFGAHGQRRTSEWREPNLKEMAYFLASLDIGHARVDVMRYYVDDKE